jgi:hypothetical protein
MNAPANLNEIPPIDRFDPAVLRRLRLIPMACMVEGFIAWCAGTHLIALSKPQKHDGGGHRLSFHYRLSPRHQGDRRRGGIVSKQPIPKSALEHHIAFVGKTGSGARPGRQRAASLSRRWRRKSASASLTRRAPGGACGSMPTASAKDCPVTCSAVTTATSR